MFIGHSLKHQSNPRNNIHQPTSTHITAHRRKYTAALKLRGGSTLSRCLVPIEYILSASPNAAVKFTPLISAISSQLPECCEAIKSFSGSWCCMQTQTKLLMWKHRQVGIQTDVHFLFEPDRNLQLNLYLSLSYADVSLNSPNRCKNKHLYSCAY